jgi:glycine/D-amino acid oxidase-like deaminating enzyme
VIGAGVVGISVAWLLQNQGHGVTLLDPALADGDGSTALRSGSAAALGLLMAHVYRRSSGRGWRLRQQSLALWQTWRQELSCRGRTIPWRPGLLQLARSGEELAAQARLVEERQRRGLALQLLSHKQLQQLQPAVPTGALGGLLSAADGQIDPLAAMAALLADGRESGLRTLAEAVERLERQPADGSDGRWRLRLAGGTAMTCDWVVICAGLTSPALLEPLGHHRPQSPVLGQALELELPTDAADPSGWPGSLSWDGFNLVPRPGRRLWLGATLEPGAASGAAEALQRLRDLHGEAPGWLRRAQVVDHWQGLRARPEGRPAPLLEQLEPGLLLASGHYRNGVLLAPASAAWIAGQINS